MGVKDNIVVSSKFISRTALFIIRIFLFLLSFSVIIIVFEHFGHYWSRWFYLTLWTWLTTTLYFFLTLKHSYKILFGGSFSSKITKDEGFDLLEFLYNVSILLQGPILVMYWYVIYPGYLIHTPEMVYLPVNFGLHGAGTILLMIEFSFNNRTIDGHALIQTL